MKSGSKSNRGPLLVSNDCCFDVRGEEKKVGKKTTPRQHLAPLADRNCSCVSTSEPLLKGASVTRCGGGGLLARKPHARRFDGDARGGVAMTKSRLGFFTRGGVSNSGRGFDSLGWKSEGKRLKKKKGRKKKKEEELRMKG